MSCTLPDLRLADWLLLCFAPYVRLTRCSRGWRSWNCFSSTITQQKMLAQANALADRSRLVDGRPTSLLQLGYDHVGLDDAWQACGSGINGSFHDADGNPLVNLETFPNMTAMNALIHAVGVKSGWCKWVVLRGLLHRLWFCHRCH